MGMVKAKKFSRKSTTTNTSNTPSVKKVATKKKPLKRIGTYTSNTASKKSTGSGKIKFEPFTKPKISQGKRNTNKTHRTTSNVLKEIKYYQKNVGFLIPHAAMVRLIKNITLDNTTMPIRFTGTAFEVIQEATENHIVETLEYAYLIARHAKRVTLFASDIQLVL